MVLFSNGVIGQNIREFFTKVGDLSSHRVDDKMRRIAVKMEEVTWSSQQIVG